MGYIGRTDLELSSAVSQQDRDGDLVINQIIEVDTDTATCYTAAVHCQQGISTKCRGKTVAVERFSQMESYLS